MKKLGNARIDNENKQKEMDREIEYYRNKTKNMTLALKNLYLDKTNGGISDKEFIELKAELKKDQNKYCEKIKELEEKLKHSKQQKN